MKFFKKGQGVNTFVKILIIVATLAILSVVLIKLQGRICSAPNELPNFLRFAKNVC